MKLCKTMLAAVLLASFGIASADVAGGSSNRAHVRDRESDIMPFGGGDPGLSLSNDGKAFSFYVNLENGPVTKINRKFGGTPINGHNNWYGNADGTRNPLPTPPLDGSHILRNLLPADLAYRYQALERYSILIMIVFIATPVLGVVLMPMFQFVYAIYKALAGILVF